MAINTHLAAVHFRIEMGGQAAEHAISALNNHRLMLGRARLAEVITNLQHAISYLKTAGTFPAELQAVESLKEFYVKQLGQLSIINVRDTPKVAAAIYANQGNLLQADPFYGNLVAPQPLTTQTA